MEEHEPGLLGECSSLFNAGDLYAVLKVEKTATVAELKKAYRKLALKVHPDRAKGDKEAATRKFQCLSKVYKILSDAGSRQAYDQTGEVPEDGVHFDKDPNKTWTDYFNELFPKVTTNRLDEDKQKYQNSDEERDDLKRAYTDSGGSMATILNTVIHCTAGDEKRFRKMLNAMIKGKEVTAFPKYTDESKADKLARRTSLQKEAKEADELMEEIAKKRGAKKPESESDLFAMIRAKKHSGLNALDALAAKYAPKPGSKKRRKSDPALEEPSDEEFAKIQAKVMAKKNKTKSASKGK